MVNTIILKYKNMSLPLKATLWFVVCNFIIKGLGFITAPILTRVLPTDEYGTVTIYNTYQKLLLIFATLELCLGAYQRGYIEHKKDKEKYTTQIVLVSNVVTIIVFGIVFLLRSIYLKLTDTDMSILCLSFLYFLVEPAYNCWLYQKRYDYDYKKSVIATVSLAICTLFLPIIALLIFQKTAVVSIRSTLIVQILFCLPFYINQIRLRGILDDEVESKNVIQSAIAFQLPLVIHSLSYLILGQVDKIMIGEMIGKSEAGIYSVAYSISLVITILQTAINQSFKPYRYQKLEVKSYKDIFMSSSVLSLFFAAIVVLFILFVPEFMMMLFPENYYEAVWVIPPVTVSTFFMFLYSIFVDIESYYKKTSYVMIVSLICAIINVAMNYVGIKIFGYIACAYTTLICYVLFAILHYVFSEKVRNEEGIKEEFVNGKFMLVLSVFLLVLMIFATLTYEHIAIRYLMIGIIVALMIIKRNILIQTLRRIKNKG